MRALRHELLDGGSVQHVGRSAPGLTVRDPLVEQPRKGDLLRGVDFGPIPALGDIGNQSGELLLRFRYADALLSARVRTGLRHLLASSGVVRCPGSGAVAQWLEQGTHNPSVVGSIPTSPTRPDLRPRLVSRRG